MKPISLLIASAAGAVIAATSGFSQQPPGFSFHYIEAERAAGQRLFDNHCASCHASKRQVFGPSLNGVVGRPAGSVAGFPYTDALKKSGIVWTEDNLLKWLAGPAAMVPNAIMPHTAFSDPAERVYVVEYLKTLKAR